MSARERKIDIRSRYFKLRIARRSFAIISIFIIFYLSWLFAFPLFGPIMANFLNGLKALGIEKGRVMLLFLASMVASSLISGYLIDKTLKRLMFICASAIVASILTFAFLWINEVNNVSLFSILLGLAAGVSPVAWGAYFADHTLPEDRGRTMGISVGIMMPIAQLFLITEPFEIGTTANAKIMIIGIWLLISLVALALKPKEKKEEILTIKVRRGPPPKQIVLYAIPIFLFYWVAGVVLSIVFPTVKLNITNELFYVIWAIPFLIGGILAGIFMDSRGRKFPTMFGLAITGVSLAIFGAIGIELNNLILIMLGIGFSFVTVFSLIIWADLAQPRSRGIYYGAGIGIMATALMIGLIMPGVIFGSVALSQIKSFMLYLGVAIFLCIPPLIMAEETLPKEVIEKRQLEEYMEEVKKKYVDKPAS